MMQIGMMIGYFTAYPGQSHPTEKAAERRDAAVQARDETEDAR